MVNTLEAVSIRLDAISLIKCALDILVPPRFWLENLLSLTWAFQSQILLISQGLVRWIKGDVPDIIGIIGDSHDRIIRVEQDL
jgi:hypothetical protein